MESIDTDATRVRPSAAESSKRWLAWLETLVITAAIPALAYWFSPHDPFLLESSFPWVIIAPILLGSRYGFAHGFTSAAALVLALTFFWHQGWLPGDDYPNSLSLGLLLTGIVTGEFGESWARRERHFDAKYNYLQTRFAEFSRVYQLLKVSHAKLEQQVQGSPASLRTTLLSFREYLSIRPFDETRPLGGVGDRVLEIFRDTGGVQMAALYPVSVPFGIDLTPAARLGRPPELVASNPLLREALRTGQTVTVNEDGYSSAADQLLAVVPLVDVYDRIWGVVAINEMPFVEFQRGTLDLLTIIGGYIGDAIRAGSGGSWSRNGAAETFWNQLERCLRDVRSHRLPAGLVIMDIGNPHAFAPALKLIQAQSRGLDTVWVPDTGENAGVVCALLPLTDDAGVATYVSRLEALLREGIAIEADSDLVISGRALTAKDTLAELTEDIEKVAECRMLEGVESEVFAERRKLQGT
jgi:hypothetical protein